MKEIVFSCEHAENSIPAEYKTRISIPLNILNSHQGFDIGAKEVCGETARKLNAFYITGNISRLMVDLNRSVFHKNLFSKYTKNIPPENKESIMKRFYFPYRSKLEEHIYNAVCDKKKFVLHLSIHSFTPVLNGITRNTDFGILYDPKRVSEKKLARQLADQLENISGLKVRKNYPYKGISDGLTTFLRKKFLSKKYAGIELEINQNLLYDKKSIYKVSEWLIEALKNVISHGGE